ncbi:hypothetical protein [Sphingomonas panacis]|uniref:hypothetical protein n=1 Tax=Sphingomonas panacis TaxID=1560345 RepID=UPI001F0B3206|nr:hypothetical protein [Sphingomonas panacis]
MRRIERDPEGGWIARRRDGTLITDNDWRWNSRSAARHAAMEADDEASPRDPPAGSCAPCADGEYPPAHSDISRSPEILMNASHSDNPDAETGADAVQPVLPHPLVRPLCRTCGSDNLARDAAARWDIIIQDWTITGLFDSTTCDDCGAESDDLARWSPLALAICARVRILQRPRVGGDRFRNREGTIVRTHFAGFYVRLDMTPRERTQKTELVETAYLEVLALPAHDPAGRS